MPQPQMNHISDNEAWNICLNLLLDDSISEVEANGPDQFFVKKNGRRLHLSSIAFSSIAEYAASIEQGLVPHIATYEKFDATGYIFEGPLRYSSMWENQEKLIRGRCHIVLPPAADSPQVTIAKKSTALATLESIAEKGSMPSEVLEFVKLAVAADLTTILSGGTGAGKALHRDTLIPTPKGFMTMGDLSVGDIVFDERGRTCAVLKKYCPLDPKSYELVFSNGERMKSSAGHLWKVTELTVKNKGSAPKKPLLSDSEVTLFEKLKSSKKRGTLKEFFSLQSFSRKREIAKIFYSLAARDELLLTRAELIQTLESQQKVHSSETTASLLAFVREQPWETISYESLQRSAPVRVRPINMGKEIPSKELKLSFGELATAVLKRDSEIKSYEQRNSAHESSVWKESVLSTEELSSRGVRNHRGRLNFGIDMVSEAVAYAPSELLIDPYVLGAWIGDGISDRQSVCGTDLEVRDEIAKFYDLTREKFEQRAYQTKAMYDWKFDALRTHLKELNLLKNKHIPKEYITSSKEQRLRLLAGLIDTDGFVSERDGCIGLGMTKEQVIRAAREIALSLGYKASEITSKIPYAVFSNGEKRAGKRVYSFHFWANDELPLIVERKRARLSSSFSKRASKSQQVKKKRIYITEIREIQDNPEHYFCIQVDSPSHLFLAGETFIPTHNTTFLEAMCKLIPHETRIGVAEDTPELALTQPNVSYLHSVPWRPGMDEKDVASLSWVVAQFNRMRTDKLIIGETRGKEFADFLVAANSGMDGSLTTLHANEPTRALDKMTNFALKGAPGTPLRSINTDIGTSIDLIIQLAYFKADSRYRVTAVQEVTSTVSDKDNAQLTTQRLYTYNPVNDTWKKDGSPTGELRKKFDERGVDLLPILRSAPETILYRNGAGNGEGRAVNGLPMRRS